ncbi:MAG TPA: DUF1559 domain-containing protein [Gemmataceae bacterium]|nr:DUF1559 domain-containing protein [Gemmataceae bacterium]
MVMQWLKRWRAGGVATVLISTFLLVLFTTENELPAREEAKPAALPSDLAKVPSDGFFLLSVRIADLWDSELAKPVHQKLAKDLKEGGREFEKRFGLPLEHVERLTIVIVDPPTSPSEPLFVVRTTKPHSPDKVLKQADGGKKAKEQKYKGQTFYDVDNDWSFCPIDDRSMVYSKGTQAIRALIDYPMPKTAGNLAGALRLATGKHSMVYGVNIKAFNDAVGDKLPPLEPFKPLLQATSGTLSVDLAEQSRAVLKLNFLTDKDAKAGIKPLKSGQDLVVGAIDRSMSELAKQKESAKIVDLVKQVRAALKASKIEQEGKTLQASANLKIDVATVGVALLEAVQKTRAAASRAQSSNNLKQIAIAMHGYNDSIGRLPAHATYDKNGKPLLSWRVMILPYIEQQDLYKQFHLDEPWDSEHNKKLLAKMPKLYASPSDEKTLKDHTTYYQGFVGKGAFFEGKQGLRFPQEFPDGTSNTLMIVEASKAVPWTKPEDIVYDASKPLPELCRPGAAGFLASLCDGSVHFISKAITEKTLRNAITRNDGNPLGSDF